MASSSPIVVSAGLPGDAGLNVASFPVSPTAVHWLLDGQSIAATGRPLLSITTGDEDWSEAGLNVTARPRASTAVHWLLTGHATSLSI
jgi:hypothetical protein